MSKIFFRQINASEKSIGYLKFLKGETQFASLVSQPQVQSYSVVDPMPSEKCLDKLSVNLSEITETNQSKSSHQKKITVRSELFVSSNNKISTNQKQEIIPEQKNFKLVISNLTRDITDAHLKSLSKDIQNVIISKNNKNLLFLLLKHVFK